MVQNSSSEAKDEECLYLCVCNFRNQLWPITYGRRVDSVSILQEIGQFELH